MRRFPYVRVSPIERAVEHPAHWRALRIVSSPVPCRPSPWATLEVWSSGRPTKSQSCGADTVCCKKGPRIRGVRNPCAQHHPACPNHAPTACSCSHELRPTCCLLGRHLDDTWSSPPSPPRCRGHRLRRASETKVEMSRSAARYAPSWPRPRRPSPWHAPCTREPLSGPGMGRSLLALLTSHGTRSLPMCPGTRRPRSCPSSRGNPGISTTAAPPASITRVQEQEWRRSELLGSRTVARVIGTRPVKACGGSNLGVVGGSLN